MWNCKLCVGKIGPWTVVAVDHASWRKSWNPLPDIPSSLPIARVDPWGYERREDRSGRGKGGRFKCAFEGGLEGAGNLLRCMSNDHSPANMKKDFFFGSRGVAAWFLSWQWKVAEGWSAVSQWKRKLEEEEGDGEHGARNIKRGMKETAATYATRKSSSEKLHPTVPPWNSGLPYISTMVPGYRDNDMFLCRENLKKFPFLFFLYSLNPNHPPLKRYNSKYFIVILE